VKLTTHLHLVPRSNNEWSYTSNPQYAFVAWCSVKRSTECESFVRDPQCRLYFRLTLLVLGYSSFPDYDFGVEDTQLQSDNKTTFYTSCRNISSLCTPADGLGHSAGNSSLVDELNWFLSTKHVYTRTRAGAKCNAAPHFNTTQLQQVLGNIFSDAISTANSFSFRRYRL
jgi:hypothetical protein